MTNFSMNRASDGYRMIRPSHTLRRMTRRDERNNGWASSARCLHQDRGVSPISGSLDCSSADRSASFFDMAAGLSPALATSSPRHDKATLPVPGARKFERKPGAEPGRCIPWPPFFPRSLMARSERPRACEGGCCASLLLIEISQIRRILALAGRHQQAIAAHDMVRLADLE
jgi:hypothetical protein